MDYCHGSYRIKTRNETQQDSAETTNNLRVDSVVCLALIFRRAKWMETIMKHQNLTFCSEIVNKKQNIIIIMKRDEFRWFAVIKKTKKREKDLSEK